MPYYLSINIESRGTPLNNGSEANVGHMWYSLTDNSGIPHDFGFGPLKDASGFSRLFGPGDINPHGKDGPLYLGPSEYSKTVEITQAQYNRMLAFGKTPTAYGFDMFYDASDNSCIDFTWKALEVGGLNPLGFQGVYWPWGNSWQVPLFVDGLAVVNLFKDLVITMLNASGSHLTDVVDELGKIFDRQIELSPGTNAYKPDSILSFLGKTIEAANAAVDKYSADIASRQSKIYFSFDSKTSDYAVWAVSATGELLALNSSKTTLDLSNTASSSGANLTQIFNLEQLISQSFTQGLLGQSAYNGFTQGFSNWLVSDPSSTLLPAIKDYDFGGLSFSPIGAFYESQKPAAGNAPSIARKTPDILDTANHGLTPTGLGNLDGNHNGKLSGGELASLRAWADGNENGVADAGEITALGPLGISEIRSTDYGFYTRGNSRLADAALVPPTKPTDTPPTPAAQPAMQGLPASVDGTETVPDSGYRGLRDNGNVYLLYSYIWDWTDRVKITRDQQYLIGTDGDDSFKLSTFEYDRSPFETNKVLYFLGGKGNDGVGGGGGNDNIWGGLGNDLLLGYEGNDKLYGEAGDDQLQGQDGNDYLNGGLGADILFGESGNDMLNGGNGNDILDGENEDDSLYGGPGADILFGGLGNDALFAGAGDDGAAGGDGNDSLAGESGNDRLFGQTGNDILWGGDGNDVLAGFTASDEAKQSLGPDEMDNDSLYGGKGLDNLFGGPGDDMLDGGDDNDLLIGQEGRDTLFGGSGDDEAQGGDGNDSLMGESGDDRLFGQTGNDILWGGGGDDILVGFTASNENKQSLNADESDNDRLYGGAGKDLLLGGPGVDTLQGGAGADQLQAGADNDLLYGEAGDDFLFGQVGNDVLYGGDGNDILAGFNGDESKESLSPGESDNDWLYGGAGDDYMLGGTGKDYLDGGAGADEMEGGGGDDTYIVNSVNDSILEQAKAGYDTVVSSANYLLNAGIEELRLVEELDIHGTGNALDNLIIGNSHDNIIDGVTGSDTLIGGGGDDTYYVDNQGDQVIELAGEGVDRVQSSISHTLGDHLENLMLLDFSKPEQGLVNLKHVLVYGYPKMHELDYIQGDAVDGYQGTCALTAIANLLTQADKPTSEAQVVRVAIKNDWAVTDPSKPAYERGGSNYQDQQAILNDHYHIRNDMLHGYNEQGVANLIISGRTVIIAVNAGKLWDEQAYIGNGKVNHAVTVTGAVYSESDSTLMGFYIADSGRHKVSDMTRYVSIEQFRAAADVGSAYAIYTLEPLKLWDEDINGQGNALDNAIMGNRGNNRLSGKEGDDTLSGGEGNDILTGGAGQDVFRFNSALTGNADRITDFVVAEDTLQLENAIFTKLTATGVLNSAYLKIGSAAADTNDYLVYNTATGVLLYDADSRGAGAAVQIATLGVGLALTHADFVVI